LVAYFNICFFYQSKIKDVTSSFGVSESWIAHLSVLIPLKYEYAIPKISATNNTVILTAGVTCLPYYSALGSYC
jgi:hypothetical protein